ncbi:MAG: transposase, partial [Planctomycetota bacterium]
MREHLATFLAQINARAESDPSRRGLPSHVRRELSGFLDCGILASGFVRAYCPACRQSVLVAFSCKARAVCPSCTGRRMAEVAAHLVDLLVRHPRLCKQVRGIFVRAVQSFYSRRARDQGRPGGRCGSVVYTQRFDSALRLDIHWHALVLDGVFLGFDAEGDLIFFRASPLRDEEIESLVRHIRVLITGHLRRRGYLDEDLALGEGADISQGEEATHQAAAIRGVIPFGPHAGRQMLLFGEEPLERPRGAKKKLCADSGGYSLHAAVRVGAGRKGRLERLCRYIARPALAQDRLLVAGDGRVVYRFRRPWRNGKQAVVMDPMTFLSRLAAQVPPRRFHLLSYYGVLAPAAYRRKEIVPRQEAELKAAHPGGGGQQDLASPSSGMEKVKRPQP